MVNSGLLGISGCFPALFWGQVMKEIGTIASIADWLQIFFSSFEGRSPKTISAGSNKCSSSGRYLSVLRS
jgi:hypothetical protein